MLLFKQDTKVNVSVPKSIFNLGGVYGSRAEWTPHRVLKEAEGDPDQQL